MTVKAHVTSVLFTLQYGSDFYRIGKEDMMEGTGNACLPAPRLLIWRKVLLDSRISQGSMENPGFLRGCSVPKRNPKSTILSCYIKFFFVMYEILNIVK